MRAGTLRGPREQAETRARTGNLPLRIRPGRVLLYLVLTAGAVFCAFPFVWMLLSALKTREEVNSVPPTILRSSMVAPAD